MGNNGTDSGVKYKVSIILAHHNCPKMAGSSNPARPVFKALGKDHVRQHNYYVCPACGTEIMLQATVKDM